MGELLSSPGMLAALAAVLVIQGLSLLVLFLNMQVYRSQSGKYKQLLSHLGNQEAWGTPGRILLPLYILCVLGATAVTTLVFLFQPHLL